LNNGNQYKILVENRAKEGWEQLKEAYPDEMDELIKFLKQYPTNLRVTHGKAKKLRGALQGYYQYDVTFSDRVRYQVDKIAVEVKVAYAGRHP